MGARAVMLFSGGLDSLLALEIVTRAGVEVTPLWMCTGFQVPYVAAVTAGGGLEDLERRLAADAGREVVVLPVWEEFGEVLAAPAHGFGRNMNPCIDCKIVMLKKAKSYMYSSGADFIVTGEVVGQRPMSQNRAALELIEREAGVEGLVLRPLSAALLPPTMPEERGWVRRHALYGFKGRNRKPHIALAGELGISRYPQPAGGCLLTDPQFSRRVKDVLSHGPRIDRWTGPLCAVGRHFRVSPRVKLIAGRNRAENAFLESWRGKKTLMEPVDVPGPSGLVEGDPPGEEETRLCCRLLARYITKAKGEIEFRVSRPAGDEEIVRAAAAPEDVIGKLRV